MHQNVKHFIKHKNNYAQLSNLGIVPQGFTAQKKKKSSEMDKLKPYIFNGSNLACFKNNETANVFREN